MRSAVVRFLAIFCVVAFSSCEKDDVKADDPTCTDCNFTTGWNSQENYSQTIPVAINYGNYQASGNLPSSVDLIPKFPPVGNQGSLSTCVAWAVGYNNKTYLDGVAQNLSQSQLQSAQKQYSPTDLFFAIDPSKRACNSGTFFDDAFNTLISRGVNNLADVPYDGVCYSTTPGSPAGASANKIKSYRRIQGSVDDIKQYLAQGIPVVIGASVNAEFQQWRGSGVLTNLNYTGNEGGHAMIIGGYDDGRNAFHIVNSWGTGWGDQGYAWVGYDFLVNKFCIQGGQRSLFVAFNDSNTPTTPTPPSSGGPDLTAIVTSDYTLYPAVSTFTNARRAFFDVKNVGNQPIAASTNWNIYYLWVDAFDANNYGIVFRGEFTTSIPQNTFQNINANYTLINYNLAPGASLSQTIGGTNFLNWDYFMPALTGNYYLVLFIDKGSSNESNQTNNVFYVTQSPKYFTNGYSSRPGSSQALENIHRFEDLSTFNHSLNANAIDHEELLFPYREPSKETFNNSYSSEEIVSFLKYKIKHGGLK